MLDTVSADPPLYLAPKPSRPETLVDQQGVFIADAQGNLIGVDTNWGRGGPLARLLVAQRAGTRDL